MFFDFRKFFNWQYLIERNPDVRFSFLLPLVVIFALMFLAGILLPLWLKRRFKKIAPYRELAARIQTELMVVSLLGLLLVFFRNQGIPYLSARILLVILGLYFLYALFAFVYYYKKRFARELATWQEEERKLRYFKRR